MSSKRLPPHEVTEEDGSRTIDIGAWKITATSKHIVTAAESDDLNKLLDFPLPEMTFGNNALRLRYKKADKEWVYQLDTVEALKLVKNGELGEGDGGVKVGYAEAWLKSR
jgi:type 2A phosphatase activator TIP41